MSENKNIISDEASAWSENTKFEGQKTSMHILTKLGFGLTLLGIFTIISFFYFPTFTSKFGTTYLLGFFSLIIGPIITMIGEKKVKAQSILGHSIYLITRIILFLIAILFIKVVMNLDKLLLTAF